MKHFEHIFGHTQNIKHLEREIELGGVFHAYLFVGPKGVGKSLIAQQFASIILDAGLSGHPDYSYVDADLAESAEDFRSSLKVFNTKPVSGGKRIVIIDNADSLNLFSSNALLKFLEEPTDQLIVILIAHRNVLPATVQSRCRVINFHYLSQNEIDSWLAKTKGDYQYLRELRIGSPGLLHSLTENPKILKAISQELDILKRWADLPNFERIEAINRLSAWEKLDIQTLLLCALHYFINLSNSNPSALVISQKLRDGLSKLNLASSNKKFILQEVILG